MNGYVYMKAYTIGGLDFCFWLNYASSAIGESSEMELKQLNPLMPSGVFNICCPRDCVSRHNGGTSGAPIMPRDAVSRTANVEHTARH